MTGIEKWIRITPDRVTADGAELFSGKEEGADMLVHIYRQAINDYPKFFKMDGLCRLGFVASEMLLRGSEGRFEPSENRAVILFNRGGSISNDRNYQLTIAQEDNFYPSPAIFVYTLPNIVTGEIAIRNKLYGETSFYVLDGWDPAAIVRTVESSFASDAMTTEALCGWVEHIHKDDYEAVMMLLRRDGTGLLPFTEQILDNLKNG